MDLNVDIKQLARSLHLAVGIAERKGSNTLSHILLTACESQKLKLTVTNNEVTLTQSLTASVAQQGSLAVHAKNTHDIIKSLGSGSVHLQAEKPNSLKIVVGQSRFRLLTLEAEQFPSRANHQAGSALVLKAGLLAEAIARTLSATASTENRYNLSGLYCELIQEQILRLVAMDGHRLALAECQVSGSLPLKQGIMFPKKAMHELGRMIAEQDEQTQVTISLTQGAAVFHVPGATLDTRLLVTEFPDYQQLIPKLVTDDHAEMDIAMLVLALRRVALFAERHNAHGVRFAFAVDSLTMTAEDPESGEAQEVISISYHGEPMTMGFNVYYVLEALSLMHSQTVRWRFTGSLSPVLLEPLIAPPPGVSGVIVPALGARLAAAGFLAVIMPLRM